MRLGGGLNFLLFICDLHGHAGSRNGVIRFIYYSYDLNWSPTPSGFNPTNKKQTDKKNPPKKPTIYQFKD